MPIISPGSKPPISPGGSASSTPLNSGDFRGKVVAAAAQKEVEKNFAD